MNPHLRRGSMLRGREHYAITAMPHGFPNRDPRLNRQKIMGGSGPLHCGTITTTLWALQNADSASTRPKSETVISVDRFRAPQSVFWQLLLLLLLQKSNVEPFQGNLRSCAPHSFAPRPDIASAPPARFSKGASTKSHTRQKVDVLYCIAGTCLYFHCLASSIGRLQQNG